MSLPTAFIRCSVISCNGPDAPAFQQMLDETKVQRYARHLALKGWGDKAQERLLNARALIVGAGGLGSPASYYLAAAGLGHMTIADGDTVELSNLNRQILFSTCDVGRSKALIAKEKIESLNPDCQVEALPIRLTPENALEHFRNADIILDCTDGFTSKYLLNDAAVLCRKPLVHAGVLSFEGHVTLIQPGISPCIRCAFPEPPPQGAMPTGAEIGIMGTVPAAMGVIQATEAIKYIIGMGTSLSGRVLVFEALDMRWMEVIVHRNPRCAICGESPTITELRETVQACEAPL